MVFHSSHQRSSPTDVVDLQRFVDAQAAVYDSVLAELRAGSKRSHWIWFIFPQLAGLGRRPTAARFALSSLAAGQACLARGSANPPAWSMRSRADQSTTSSGGQTISRSARR